MSAYGPGGAGGGGWGPPGQGYGPPGGPGYGPPGGQGHGYGPHGYGPPGAPHGQVVIHGYAGHGPVAGGHATTHHEFNVEHEAEIAATGGWARALGVVLFVQTGVALLSWNVVGAAVSFFIGLAFWKAGQSLDRVAKTQGHDVAHLMEAMRQIGTAFHVRNVLVLIVLALVLFVATVLGVVSAVT